MKTENLISIMLCAWFLPLGAGCALAQELALPAVPITVEAYVSDPDGKPVEGAIVHLSLPRYRLGDQNQWADSNANKEGLAVVSGVAQQDYSVSVSKTGYYPTYGLHRNIDTNIGFQKYAIGVQKIDLELRPIKDPVHGISKFVDRLRIPVKDAPAGFDLEIGDWVAPFGKGKSADLVFSLSGYIKSNRDYDLKLTLSFSQAGDGLILAKYPPRIGSAFKFPYEAPLTGYKTQRGWRSSYDGKSLKMNFGNNGETNYIFRVRTEQDEKGNVRRALYGRIGGEVLLGGSVELVQNVNFTYVLNPDWTRNLEFDSRKIFEAGTGKLLVQPPSE